MLRQREELRHDSALDLAPAAVTCPYHRDCVKSASAAGGLRAHHGGRVDYPNEDVDRRERTNENKASYEVPKILKVDAATLTAKSEPYVIKNPDRGGNYDFVAVLYMQDSSGRDVEVYRSGRIPVGYHIVNLTLTPPEGNALTAGTYDAKIVFSFYHNKTGEKGMVDSTAPVTVEIE